jgi:hypothetical protein
MERSHSLDLAAQCFITAMHAYARRDTHMAEIFIAMGNRHADEAASKEQAAQSETKSRSNRSEHVKA